ncbi:STAS domain-containing protein [Pelagicoccus sp. SDUM812003]|uniref:STAS domain-containing protein n=1 Tax=Pelagicoccus sp. SDUM812003 TaxID=3041267 RepID=UPI00280E0F7F|nr:STAS domain-containing protein [Pelagicoccus sp. SDUM812003]MDQ8203435.1 STAS domain-containing protein [Pelagicoccus sp. SDUM812003]
MSLVIEGQTVEGTLRAEVGVSRLDASSARDFKKQIDALWSDAVTGVEFDFSRVDFLDSSGVGALLGVYKKLPSGSASVRLLNVKAPVQSVIELLRLHRIFEIAS